MKIFLFLLLVICGSFCQTKYIAPFDTGYVCWDNIDTLLDSLSYYCYYKSYDDTSDVWHNLGTTDSLFYKVNNLGMGNYILGVKAYKNGKYSTIHSSLDSTACAETLGSGCGAPCIKQGPWYISWYLGKPYLIRIMK